jgi:hypothetical protein
MNSNINDLKKSESQVKSENISDEDIIDLNLATEVKVEIKLEIDDFETEKYDLPQIIGEKRKNKEITKINSKKFKEEFEVFEENDDDQSKTDDKVLNTIIKYQTRCFDEGTSFGGQIMKNVISHIKNESELPKERHRNFLHGSL